MLTCGLLRTNFSFDTAVSLGYVAEPSARIELATPSLPRKCTATVLRGRMMVVAVAVPRCSLERSGRRDSNPRQPAWKAGALPAELHPQSCHLGRLRPLSWWSRVSLVWIDVGSTFGSWPDHGRNVEGGGFEPP